MSERVLQRGTQHGAGGSPTLKATEELFALEYLANGYNATAAYRSVHPKCSQRTAEVNGSRLLRKAEVATFIERDRRARVKRLHMDADEALLRVALDARADLRKLFDAAGQPIEPQHWPDDIANSVESFERKKDGSFKVKLASKTMARRTILEHTGTLKSPVEGEESASAVERWRSARHEAGHAVAALHYDCPLVFSTIERGAGTEGTSRIRVDKYPDAIVLLCGALAENDWAVYVPGTVSPKFHTYGRDQEALLYLADKFGDLQACVEEALFFVSQPAVQEQIDRVAAAPLERTSLTADEVRQAAGFSTRLCSAGWIS